MKRTITLLGLLACLLPAFAGDINFATNDVYKPDTAWPQTGDDMRVIYARMARSLADMRHLMTNGIAVTGIDLSGTSVNTETNISIGLVSALPDGMGTNAMLATSGPGGANNSGPLAVLPLVLNSTADGLNKWDSSIIINTAQYADLTNRLQAIETATWNEEEVDGSFTFSPTNGASLNSGTQVVTVEFTPTDTNTFNSVSLSITITNAQGNPEFSVSQLVSTLSHPVSFDTNYFSPSSVQDAMFSFSKAQGAALHPGNNTVVISCSPWDTNYFQTNISFTITVTGVEGGKARIVQSTNHPIGRLVER